VVSTIHKADGVVGDLGGGSLELIDVKGEDVGKGVSLKLGSLALMDSSGRSIKNAQRIAKLQLAEAAPLEFLRGRTFYASAARGVRSPNCTCASAITRSK